MVSHNEVSTGTCSVHVCKCVHMYVGVYVCTQGFAHQGKAQLRREAKQ